MSVDINDHFVVLQKTSINTTRASGDGRKYYATINAQGTLLQQ
jgi:hypothetical protein